jgi:hypothetical protein
MYTTPGLELLLRMNVESLERAVREQRAPGQGRPTLRPSLKSRITTTLSSARRATQAAAAHRSPAPAVPCCA